MGAGTQPAVTSSGRGGGCARRSHLPHRWLWPTQSTNGHDTCVGTADRAGRTAWRGRACLLQAAGAERAGSKLCVWTYAARIPEPVDHAAAAVVGSSIYVAGGRIENLVTNKFWRYDAGTDSWTELPSMPIPRFGPTMQAVGQRLYIIGGAISHGRDATSMMVYDIPSMTWSVYEYAIGGERA